MGIVPDVVHQWLGQTENKKLIVPRLVGLKNNMDYSDVKNHKMCDSCKELALVGDFMIMKDSHPLCFKRWWYENGFKHYGFDVISRQTRGAIAGGKVSAR